MVEFVIAIDLEEGESKELRTAIQAKLPERTPEIIADEERRHLIPAKSETED